MREILFRGQRVDTKEWVFGSLVKVPIKQDLYNTYRIYYQPFECASSNTYHQVFPETVGQFTGLTDKNGKKIFEGDILQKWDVDYDKCIELNYIYDEEPMNATKKDVATMGRFPVYWLRNESFGYEGDDLESPNDWEIIGNIHDNPELLKGGQ